MKRAFGLVTVAAAAAWVVLLLPYARAGQRLSAAKAAAAAARVPVSWADVAGAKIPAEANAAVHIEALAGLVPKMRDSKFTEARAAIEAGQGAKALALLGQYGPAIREAEKAAELPYCRFEKDWSKAESLTFPELSAIKETAKGLHARSWALAAVGDSAGAARDIATMRALARCSRSSPAPVGELVGLAVHSMAATAAVRAANEFRGKAGPLATVRGALGDEPEPKSVRQLRAFEAMLELDLARRADRGLLKQMSSSDMDGAEAAPFWVPALLLQTAYQARALERWAGWFQASDAPGREGPAQLDWLQSQTKALLASRDPVDALGHLVAWEPRHLARSMRIAQARHRTAYAFVRALEHEARTGAWPADAGLADPFADGSLRTEAKPGSYRVWSVGENRQDDGGRETLDEDRSGHRPDDVVAATKPG